MSSEDLAEIPQLQKLSIPHGFQNKEAASSSTPSITLSQVPDLQPGSQLFTEIHLAKIEKMFEEDISSTGALGMDAFIKAMKKVLSSVSDEMLKELFLKVDSDCEGFVTWQKYVDYMMREFQGKEDMRKSQYRLHFYLPMTVVPLNHGCEVVKVVFLIHRFKKIGCFLTVTKDGILQFWSESFSLMSSFRLNQTQQLYNQPMWVIDMVCLHNMNLVAVASTRQKIDFFDISDHKCVRAFTFVDLDSCALVMDYWSDYHRGVFCYGDAKGNVIVFTSENMTSGLFNPRILPRASKWDHWIKVSLQKLLNEKSALHRSYRLKALHPNWCEQVKFIPQMNVVVSCSAIEKSSLVLTILPAKASKKPRLSVLHLRKGILCFDYCPDRNFLVTGGYDASIRLWNPFVSKRPVWLMKGHQTSVTHILVDSRNNSILISVSKDKNIRVWDMLDYICLQSFCGKFFALGNCPITSAYFFEKDNTLICSTYSIGILKGYLEAQGPIKARKRTTHCSPLCAVLYSKIFKQVVSGCLRGTVSVWEVVTGRKTMEFAVSGGQHVEMTAMALDESERCLLTGLRDGTMKMWNYNIGKCLLTFPSPEQLEISGIIHMNKVFYVTGWSKRITHFLFHKTKPVLLCYHWQTYHTEDILSMAKYQNQFLGTSSYSGDILFWNTGTFKPIFNFNASRSPLPLQPKRVQDVNNCLAESHRPSRPYVEREKWAYKTSRKLSSLSPESVANTNLRRSLVSAPPVMRCPRDKEPDRPVPQQKPSSASGTSRQSSKIRSKQSIYKEDETRKGELQKNMLVQSSASVEKIIFLQTRPRLPHTAALLSSCMDGYIYAWSLHGNGGLLGKFPVDLDNGDVVVGAMATDKNDWILITGDCKGYIKIWDIKDYCALIDKQPFQSSGAKVVSEAHNKFRLLIPQQLGTNFPHYIPLEDKEVVAGHTISLVPPTLLITWKGHLNSVADILYVDNFQLVISAGQDRDVKAWKLSGDAIGTFGLSVWKRLQDACDGPHENRASLEEDGDSTGTTQKVLHLELQEQRDLAEALIYQRREQAALMALLHGKADKEADAWAKLQKMALMSPWAGERPLEDIEDSWNKWESRDKQVSKVLGAAYKPKERLQNTRFLSTRVPYGWMKHQISPQVYQSLHFSDLMPTQQPDFLTSRGPDQQDQHIRLVAHHVQKDLVPSREQAVLDTTDSTPAAASSPSSLLSVTASASRLLDSSLPAFLTPQFSFLLRPQSASTAHSTPSVPSPVSKSTLQRSVTPKHIVSSFERSPRPLKATFMSSVKGGSHVRF
ncbi:EFCAB8 isoform 1 [Pan troglodytes]|uniref:WD repeat-containing protein on Y chromosome n=4 Tax=Pan troglodytes TaxID=9598 RepID=A0A6D2WVJ3_PANTR|nr:EF-hand calcium-binding domain-containing protein 8 [Pan troglodytes]XP_054530626.1 EF-hand calcium-binding domain-containing protein 8 [Pan troglodytes]XP_054530627.1 EF-hand calcium-binding domain-containing protein 8 [Pan troglodytes]PNI27728.1 EFCAB8 isoform 1 [Pan troglodytes]